MSPRAIVVVSFSCFAFACGPAARHNNGENVGGPDAPTNCQPENTPAACSDGVDNDCDGLVDCADPDCSGVGNCPICGMVEHPLGTPFFLPDGQSSGTSCTSNAQCSGATPNCIIWGSPPTGECHASYTNKLNFVAFGPTQTLTQVSDIVSVCINMEHEWIRDLQIELHSPSGQLIRLDEFKDRTGGEVYLGEPYDEDEGYGSGPHVGYDYCFKPTATNPAMLDFANSHSLPNYTDPMSSESHPQLPAGDYQASDPWTMLVGSTLNGDWQLVITDLWGIDVGYVHSWQISFNPMIVQNCSGPIIQ